MSERYQRLYVNENQLYAVGSPVIIMAGALLLDNVSSSVLTQLKFKSITEKVIRALKVEVTAYDSANREVGEKVVFDYLDLNTSIGAEFGSKTPIALPDATTRSFSARVIEVIFADGSLWSDNGGEWKELKKQASLSDLLEEELLKQFRIQYGTQCYWQFMEEADLWHCACGTINKDDVCRSCNLERNTLKSIDYEQLKKDCDARLLKEKEEKEAQLLREKQEREEQEKRRLQEKAEQEERERQEKEAQKEKLKKIKKISAITMGVLVLFLVLNSLLIQPWMDSRAMKVIPSGEIKVGEVIKFGGYEQNNIENGKEVIEWRVLDKKGNKLLVVSEYALECKAYHDEDTIVNWETSSLRKWMNNEFLEESFTEEQIQKIAATELSNVGTKDKVFLLSITETKLYKLKECEPTKYVRSKANTYKISWWIRSSDYYRKAPCKRYKGANGNEKVSKETIAVRPAMWIDLSE